MPITASVTNQQITASVGETKIDVSVGGGVGPTGSSGTVAVSAPITNAGTTTAANIGLSVGTGLAVSGGSLVASYGTTAGTACEGNDARLSDSREWSASTATQAEAEAGTSTTRRAFTPQRVFQAIAAWWAGSAAKTKLDGIATGATANQTDAYLLSRANHTGTQSPATVTTATTYSNFLPSGGSLDTALSGIDSALAGKVGTSDSRLTDQRVPTDGSVTTAKLADGSVTAAKIATWQSVAFNVVTSNTLAASTSIQIINSGTFTIKNPGAVTQFAVSGSGVVTAGTWQGTAVAVAYGGTGATTASGARTNLGLAIGTDIPALSHAHSGEDIMSGTVATARLATRVRNASRFYLWSSFR